MASAPEVVLFEAVSSPPGGLSASGMRWLCWAGVTMATVPAALFALLGAWPVVGFLGGELVLVIGLVALHRRWSRRAVETVLLTDGRLTVKRLDGRGKLETAELEPYWTRLELEERPGAVPVLRARARGTSIELGRFLAHNEKHSLALALNAALQGYRTPVFDNPQLRE